VIHSAATPIIRRVSEPIRGRRGGGATATCSAAAAGAAGVLGIFEAVAETADGGDHVGTELLSDPGDEHLDRVRIPVEILIVDMFDQLGPAHHLAFVVHQVAQKLVLLRGELHRLAGLGDLAGAGVEPDVAGDQLRAGIAGRSADQGPKPGDQLLGLERLGKIIVGSRVETRDLVRPAVAGGQNEDRHLPAFLAPAVEHGQAVDLREAQVEDHSVIGFG
jgi:hypothetical protein